MMLKEQRLSQKHTLKKKLIPLKKCQMLLLYERASQGAQERKKRNAGKIKKQVMSF